MFARLMAAVAALFLSVIPASSAELDACVTKVDGTGAVSVAVPPGFQSAMIKGPAVNGYTALVEVGEAPLYEALEVSGPRNEMKWVSVSTPTLGSTIIMVTRTGDTEMRTGNANRWPPSKLVAYSTESWGHMLGYDVVACEIAAVEVVATITVGCSGHNVTVTENGEGFFSVSYESDPTPLEYGAILGWLTPGWNEVSMISSKGAVLRYCPVSEQDEVRNFFRRTQ